MFLEMETPATTCSNLIDIKVTHDDVPVQIRFSDPYNPSQTVPC